MRIPLNLIKTGKYTSGGEYVIEKSNTPYKGFYYEYNNSLYAGRQFNLNAPKIIKISDANQLYYNNSDTAIFSFNSKITSQHLQTPSITSLPNSQIHDFNSISFFCKKINTTPIIIKKINEVTYNNLKNSPLYQIIYIGTYQNKTINSNQAYSQMVGLKEFVEG